MKCVSRNNTEQYAWGVNCYGWPLVNRNDLSVIEETMAPGSAEVEHYHRHAQQFFYVLDGVALMRLPDCVWSLSAGQGLHVPQGIRHYIYNASKYDVSFLVISQPSAHGDRIIIASEND